MSRWWSPEAAFDEPDEVVKAAFVPVEDGNEVGTALLGVHRAVAGAVAHRAAAGPIDGLGLVQAMAGMREQVAGPAVDAIAKSAGEDAAVELVSSFCDRAEQGALDLFTRATARGVTPATAAQRAAATYGVPFAKMGRYIAPALEQKTSPVVLTDLADEVLLGYVMRAAAPEPVGKAGELEGAELADFNRRHPRDAEGQFAPKGQQSSRARVMDRFSVPTVPNALQDLLSRSEQKIAEEDQAAAAPTAPAAPARRKKDYRAKSKKKRDYRATGRQVPEQVERQQAQRTQKTRSQKSRAQAERKQLQRKVQTLLQSAGVKAPPRGASVFDYAGDGDIAPLEERTESTGLEYGKVGSSVALYTSGGEWQSLRRQLMKQAMSGAGPLVVQMGHIQDVAGDGGHLEHDVRDMSVARRGANEVELNRIEDAEGVAGVDIAFEAVTESQLRSSPSAEGMVTDVVERLRAGTGFGQEAMIQSLPEYVAYGEVPDEAPRNFIVRHHWGQDSSLNGRYHEQVTRAPSVVEFVVLDARGNAEDRYVELDPNQHYKVSFSDSGTDSMFDQPEEYWDPENQTIVQRVYLTPTDDVGKAARRPTRELTGVELAEFNEDHPRGADGRWVSDAEVDAMRSITLPGPGAPAPQARRKKDYRAKSKKKRDYRTTRAQLEARAREQSGREQKQRGQKQRGQATRTQKSFQQVSRRQAERARLQQRQEAKQESTAYQLTSDAHYQVLDSQAFDRTVDAYLDLSDRIALSAGQDVPIIGPIRRGLAEREFGGEADVVERLRYAVDRDVNYELVTDGNTEWSIEHLEADEVQDTVESLMDSAERLQVLRIEVMPDEDRGLTRVSYTTGETGFQSVVKLPIDYDPDVRYAMRHVGVFKMADLVDDDGADTSMFNGLVDQVLERGHGTIPMTSVSIYEVHEVED